MAHIVYFVTEDWYFCSHRLPLAVAAREAGHRVSVVTRVGGHGPEIRSAGLELIDFPLQRRGINPLRELGVLLRLARVYRELKPDLVHHVALKPVLYGSLAARLAGRPAVVNAVAGLGHVFAARSALLSVLRFILEKAFRVLLNGKNTHTIIQNLDDGELLKGRMGLAPDKVVYILGSGVDLSRFVPVPPPPGPPAVLLASRLLWAKGVGEFVQAAEVLKSRGVEGRFLLAGEPDMDNPGSVTREQLSRWHESGAVEWLGFQADMPRLLSTCHVFCLPSYYGEGVPKALLEAAACGRPIVTTDMPGCRDTVVPGRTGLLVPPRDVEALTGALEKLILDAGLRDDMGRLARERAEEEFGLEIVIEKTLALYESLLGRED